MLTWSRTCLPPTASTLILMRTRGFCSWTPQTLKLRRWGTSTLCQVHQGSRFFSADPCYTGSAKRSFPNWEGALLGTGPLTSTLKGSAVLVQKSSRNPVAFALSYPSVGATEQILLTAVQADGITTLTNAAVEPEITDLINVLQKMGAIISVDTDRTIRIEGVDRLEGFVHSALPDRIEAASWGAAALATRGDVFVKGAHQPDMTTFLNTFRKVGGKFDVEADGIRFYHPGGELKPIVLETNVHPGFMTDWQQPLVVALTQADGLSIVHETVYENRFGFTSALRKMGANIQLYKECVGSMPCRFGASNFYHSAVISGPTPLHAADITVPDLRGGFSHLIAALAAEGTSHVSGIDVISRGYEHFISKLRALHADIEYV